VSQPYAADARALLASARELLLELEEEGVETIERMSAPSPALPARTPAPPPPEPATPPARSAPAAISAPAAKLAEAAEPVFSLAGDESGVPDVAWGPEATLAAVRSELGDCTRCDLCKGRKQIVFGDGDPNADLMFIGEGPGQREDETGLPFVGRAGELLTQMIEQGLQIPRSSVYICNIVKCRPPNNRNPLPDEVSRCRPFLDGQIAALKPKVIVSLGKPAASLLLGRDIAITRVRGTWQQYQGIPLMPTLHPAFILRQYTQEIRRLVWEDLKAALERSRQ
jgi:DNA polymerase